MTTLSDLDGTTWKGTSELWLDPLGDQAARSESAISVNARIVRYTWSHDGKAHAGSITLREGGADFADTFHSPAPMKCAAIRDAPGLFQAQGAYGPDSDWGWRIGLFVRTPTGELVLQMTNIAPWGEEARAVRVVCQREASAG